MESGKIYIIIAVVSLVAIGLMLLVKQNRNEVRPLTPLAGLAFSFVLAGIIFGDERLLGYSLIGVGLVLSIVDIVRSRKKDKNPG